MSFDSRTPSFAFTVGGQMLAGDANGLAQVIGPPASIGQILRVDAAGVLGFGALLSGQHYLGADVSMPAANTFYDGPTWTGLTANLLWFYGAVTVLFGVADKLTARLWTGSGSPLCSAEASGAAGDVVTLVLIGATGLSAGTMKISVASVLGGHTIKATCPDNDTGTTASSLSYVVTG